MSFCIHLVFACFACAYNEHHVSFNSHSIAPGEKEGLHFSVLLLPFFCDVIFVFHWSWINCTCVDACVCVCVRRLNMHYKIIADKTTKQSMFYSLVDSFFFFPSNFLCLTLFRTLMVCAVYSCTMYITYDAKTIYLYWNCEGDSILAAPKRALHTFSIVLFSNGILRTNATHTNAIAPLRTWMMYNISTCHVQFIK